MFLSDMQCHYLDRATDLLPAWLSLCYCVCFLSFQVQAYNQKASILDELGQTHDALHQLHLSLECLAGILYNQHQV